MSWLDKLRRRLTGQRPPGPSYKPMPPHPANVPGSFYVENGCCLFCGVWEDVASDMMSWLGDDPGHCYISRQPQTDEEFGRMVEAMQINEVDCIRVRHCKSAWKDELIRQGLVDQIDPE
ncbi:hypothetical protein OVY48_11055 [Sphingobium sp. SA2]|uniref:hypothetical protein n=1 Tax=unclassified Sphingobium TaxID=2611147 RepID=UPI001143FE43|nr:MULTISPECIES: hypothetical protein [unclassified Sphingobium]MDT7533961.1 hypothetical protein [Sphingobium sp. SA2]